MKGPILGIWVLAGVDALDGGWLGDRRPLAVCTELYGPACDIVDHRSSE